MEEAGGGSGTVVQSSCKELERCARHQRLAEGRLRSASPLPEVNTGATVKSGDESPGLVAITKQEHCTRVCSACMHRNLTMYSILTESMT